MKSSDKIFMVLMTLLFQYLVYSQNIHSEKLDDYVNYIQKNNLDIGSISIFQDGKEMYFNSFGKIQGKKFNKNTEYQVGSITKLFTATLIFTLIEQHKISLDTPLRQYFPDVKNSDKITIQNLLEHSSGLNNYVKKDEKTVWLKEPRTQEEIMKELMNQRILFSPNENVSYSNSGYYLLGKIIEKEYHKKYNDVLKEQITGPFHLSKTQSALDHPTHIAESYLLENNLWVLTKDFYFKNIIGVGDMSSNTQDLNRFINLLFDHKILSKETVAKMKPIIGKETYGRGLMTFKFHNIDFYGNTGGTYGTNTILIFDEASKTSIALIINGEKYPRNECINDIVDIIYNDHLSYPKESTTL
ncbi:serine hydrolase [Chryseobacterium piperi]|uniref:serine hydrolase domain-containing protein n=1 Tax=Chryseobacterium piperi TaxID=558152 RepID=UPI0009FF7A52|nr:serine hydrolase domain-containing protein [Chryseobacterium piperi]ASW76524.1 serine hydrolase [Chryseobacterium piperi]